MLHLALVLFSALPAAAQVPVPDHVCIGATRTYWVDSTNYPGSTYIWAIDGAEVQNGTRCAFVHTWNAEGLFTLSIRQITADGCAGDPQTSQVFVTPSLPASVSIISDQNNVCRGTTVTFTAAPVNGGAVPVYQWVVNGSDTGTNSNTFAYIPSGGDRISVVMTSGESCVSGSPATSNEITMLVSPPAPVSITIVAGANPVYAGTPVTFTAAPVNGGLSPVYAWYVNHILITGENSSAFTYIPADQDSVQATLLSDETCASGNPATSNAILMKVDPLLPVSVTISTPLTTVCAGTPATFTATPVNGGTGPVYTWYLNGTVVQGETGATWTYIPANGDQVYVMLLSDLEHVTGNPATSPAIEMAVTTLPAVSITPVSPLCSNAGAITLNGTPPGGTFSGPGVTGSSFDPAAAGSGTHVIAYDYAGPDGCGNSATLSIVVNVAPVLVITNPAAACLPGTVDLTAAAVTAGSSSGIDLSYWLDAGASLPMLTPNAAAAGVYYIKGTTSSGCFVIGPVTVTVNSAVDLVITDPSPVCEPGTVDLTGSAITAGSTPGLEYTYWMDAGCTIPVTTPSAAGAGTYYIMGRLTGWCPAIKPVHVTVNPSVGIPVFDDGASSARCQAGGIVIYHASAANATGLIYSLDAASMAGGNSIDPVTGALTFSASWNGISVVTATVTGCNGPKTAMHSITTNPLPGATISYPGTQFCTSEGPVTVNRMGTAGGTYSAFPDGLSIDPDTGTILPGSSNPGTYTITYAVSAGGCGTITATAIVTILETPVITISYSGSLFCTTAAPADVILNGAGQGTFTSSPAGLSLDALTGTISPALSQPGEYVVTCTAATACGPVTATFEVIIKQAPFAEISYPGSPFCTAGSPRPVELTGTAGGRFSAVPAGLAIDSITGDITPATSREGNYTIRYFIEPAGGCASYTTQTTISVITAPSATIQYINQPYCLTSGQVAVTLTGTAGGSFRADPAGLTIDAATGMITPSASTVGFYTVIYTLQATGGCPEFTTSSSLWIIRSPEVTISYPGSPFCVTSGPADVILSGSAGGTFTAVPAGLVLDPVTGTIQPSGSTPGDYTVTYKGQSSCGDVSVNTAVSVTSGPQARISYPVSTFCTSAGPVDVQLEGAAGGQFSAVPDGLAIDPLTGMINPGISVQGTYTVTYTNTGISDCGQGQALASTTVMVTPAFNAHFYYNGTPFCTSSGSELPAFTGSGSGTFSSSPGLTINPSNGMIIPGTSAPGTYVVTYSIPSTGTCSGFNTTAPVTILGVPTAAISYDGPFCSSLSVRQPVTLNGDPGGKFSSTSGLSINKFTGEILPSASVPGAYTVTYIPPPNGICSGSMATTDVVISSAPSAAMAYDGSPFCQSLAGQQNVSFTGNTGGHFSATPAGLILDPATGALTPAASTEGKYRVTYTLPASGGCDEVSVTTTVTITAVPSATISYPGSPYCAAIKESQPPIFSGTRFGTYSSSPGLFIDGLTGAVSPWKSSAGSYLVTYTIPASGGCSTTTATTEVTIINSAVAGIAYPDNEFCTVSPPVNAMIDGGSGGLFASTPQGLDIDTLSGTIRPAASAPGTYTVTYTIPPSGACPGSMASTRINILRIPSAAIFYNSPLCASLTTGQQAVLTGDSGGKFFSSPGLAIDSLSGEVLPATSIPGTYTVTYRPPSNGICSGPEATATVVISPLPSAMISYLSPLFCQSLDAAQPAALEGTAGGYYTATPPGLSIDSLTGAITPAASTGGTYVVTYTLPASAGCDEVRAMVPVTITPAPTATVSYPGSPYCASLGKSQFPVLAGNSAGYWSSTAGLLIDSITGAVTPDRSAAGTYLVTYTIPAGGGCPEFKATATVAISISPVATFAYGGSAFCNNSANPLPAFTGEGRAGWFTAGPGLVFADNRTGEINLASSQPGTYTIVNTIEPADGCNGASAIFTVTIMAPVTISASPADQTVTYPSDALFTVKADGPGLTCQWQVDAGNGFIDLVDSGAIRGANTDSLHITAPLPSMSGYRYRVNIRGTCDPQAISKEAVLTVVFNTMALHITADAADKVYDGTRNATVTLANDRQTGDSLVITYSEALFDTPNAGTGKPVNVTGIMIGGPDAFKYTFEASAVATAAILPKPITIRADAGLKKSWGSPDPVFTYSCLPELIASDRFDGSLTRVSGENPGFYPILEGTLNPGGNYAMTFIPSDFEITHLAVISIIPASGQGKVYGDPDPVLTCTFDPPLAAGDSVTGWLYRAPGENTGEYPISIGTLALHPKYAVTFTGSYFVITPRHLSVKAVPDDKVYDGTTLSDEEPLVEEPLAFRDSSRFTQSYGTKAAGISKTMIPSGMVYDGNDGKNYLVTFVDAHSGTITPKALVGMFTPAGKVYDGTTAAVILTRTAGQIIPDDRVVYEGGSAVFENPWAGLNKTVYGTGFILTGADAGNYTVNDTASAKADILPLEVQTSLTLNSGTFTHYTDLITLTATIAGGAPLVKGPPAATSVTFSIDGHGISDRSGNTRIPLTVSGADLVATLTLSLLETTAGGTMIPGTKEAVATFNDDDPDYTLVPNPAAAVFEFSPGNTILIYPNPSTGPIIFNISVDVGDGEYVTLDLFAPNGQMVAHVFEGVISAGKPQIIRFEGKLAQGVYIYRAVMGKDVRVGNIVVIRYFK